MTPPARYDIKFKRGDHLYRRFTFDDDGDPPTLMNFTGCTAKLQVRAGEKETDLLVVDLSDKLTNGGAAGYWELSVPSPDTLTFAAGRYRWAMVVIDVSGKPRTYLEGNFEESLRVTVQA